MDISENIQLGLLGLLIFQCFFFALFLFTQLNKAKKSNVFLGLLLVTLGIHMSANFLSVIEVFYADPKLLVGLSALYGPFIYFTILALQKRAFPLGQNLLVHFILAPLAILLSYLGNDFVEIVIRVVVLIQVYTYLILSITSIKQYQRVLLQTQSQYQTINLSWAIYLLSFWIFIAAVDLVNNIFNFYAIVNEEWVFIFLLFSMLIFVNTMFFKGLVQPQLFRGISAEDEDILKQNVQKYRMSQFNEEDLLTTKKSIDDIIENSKIYLEPELNLEVFSKAINCSPRLVSQTINSIYKTNFSDFINDIRIEEAKHLLIHDHSLNVSEILYQVGFNSKSAFYDHFKKKTGFTPNQYKNSKNNS